MDDLDARIRAHVGPIVSAAVAEAMRTIPAARAVPGTVVQMQTEPQFGDRAALVHIDGDPPGELRQVAVTDSRRYLPGERVQVEFQPPAGAVIRGSTAPVCQPCIALAFTHESEPVDDGGALQRARGVFPPVVLHSRDLGDEELFSVDPDGLNELAVSVADRSGGGLWRVSMQVRWSVPFAATDGQLGMTTGAAGAVWVLPGSVTSVEQPSPPVGVTRPVAMNAAGWFEHPGGGAAVVVSCDVFQTTGAVRTVAEAWLVVEKSCVYDGGEVDPGPEG